MEARIYTIGIEATMDVIGGKWKLIILYNLRHGAVHSNDLERGVTGINQEMLIQQLRELEEDNIAERKIYNRVPPKVKYYLSGYDQGLSAVLDNSCSWRESHVVHLQE